VTIEEIISLIANLGIGLDEPSKEDKEVFLKYLNLAHAELFRLTALINPKIKVLTQNIKVNNGIAEELQEIPFIIKTVYLGDKQLIPVSTKQTGIPRCWHYMNETIHIYPVFDGEIKVTYIPEPEELKLNTEKLPYPISYHSVLIDGACYYLFQAENKDNFKIQQTLMKWERGKNELFAFLNNAFNKQYYSTYNVV
jgi:hypothetical protein